MLDLRRLQVMAAVHRYGTMTAAAAHLHTATSAVSQQVALLEKEVGLPLFDRHGRTVRLNEAGRTLLEHYRLIATAVEQAEHSLDRFRSGVEGTVRISTFPSFAATVLPQALMNLRESHPRLSPVVVDLEPHDSVARLREGDVDVAVVDDLQPVADEGLTTVQLARDEIVLCLPPGHPPVPAGPLSLESLAGQGWVTDAPGTPFEAHTRRLCQQAGFEPRVVGQCSNLTAQLALVRAGFGVALMSSLNLGPATRGLVVRHVDPPLHRGVRILHRSTSTAFPAVEAVVRELVRVTGERQRCQATSDITPA